ncbi:hypothetical protein M9458_038313, partial [Cirrhinus mrigala]
MDAEASGDVPDSVMQLSQQQRRHARQKLPCANCGSRSHATRAQICPAQGQTCHNCGKQNHFASVCRSASNRPQPRTNQSSPAIIHNVTSGLVPFKSCTVMLNDMCIPLLLDTGASVSLLNVNTYNQFFSELPLATPSTALCGYGESTIELLGSLSLTIVYGKRTLPSFVFHVAHKGANLMGLDLFSVLGFALVDTEGAAVLTVPAPWQQQWPTLFKGLGCLSSFMHQPLIDYSITPVIQPLCRIPLVLWEGVSAELQCLLSTGIIEPLDALPWVSNLVVATKKSGALCICLDLRRVNNAVIPDKYPLPTTEELTAQFYGSTVFSKLDLREGYLQVMTTVLAEIPGVVIYLDDIVVHGPTADIHNEHLNKGISPLQSNVETIQSIPEPISPAQVASFLGMTGYYLKFLPQYSTTTAPLRQLLQKDVPWVWTQEGTEVVHNLKAQLTSPPIMSHFSTSCKTMVTCNASATSIGTVLSQEQNGVKRPIAFASRALNPTEQRYSVGEREALACVWSCERWHLYLYGHPFALRTDHHASVALLATSGTGHRSLRLHRWYDRLHQYNYKLQFTPGCETLVADLLSCSVPVQGTTDDVNHPETDIIQLLHTPLQRIVSLQELKTTLEQDPILSQLRTYIREGWPAQVSGELPAFARVKDELESCWNDTCVVCGLCTMIPEPLRARVLKMAHEGHLGIVKLKQRCQDRVLWLGINSEIKLLVKDCPACLVSGKMGKPRPPPLQPLTWPTRPWQHLQLDICGEIHWVSHNQRYLVLAYDLHSKWPELTTTGSVSSQIIVDFLDSLFTRWGLPQMITTDNGPQFVSADFSSYLRSKGIQQIHTTLYHSQANGGVERFH